MRTTPSGRLRLLPALVGALVACAAAAALPAQSISGTVLDVDNRQPVAGAEIAAGVDGQVLGRTMADDEGHFFLRLPSAGAWTLAVRRVGYQPIESVAFEVEAGEWITVEVTLDPSAVLLQPLVVTARRSAWSRAVRDFYDRRDGARRSGFGYFVGREEIERMRPFQPSDLLRGVPGVRVIQGRAGRGSDLRMSTGCVPAIYIDGMQINRTRRLDSLDDFVTVMDIEGIEVYRGAMSQVGHLYDPSGCGLVLVWTRGGFHDPGARFPWKAILGILGAGALLLLLN